MICWQQTDVTEDASVAVIRCVSMVSGRAAASEREFGRLKAEEPLMTPRSESEITSAQLLSITDLIEGKAPLYLLF